MHHSLPDQKPVERMIDLTPAAFAKQALKDGEAEAYIPELIRQHDLFAKGQAHEIARLHAAIKRVEKSHDAEVATLFIACWLASL